MKPIDDPSTGRLDERYRTRHSKNCPSRRRPDIAHLLGSEPSDIRHHYSASRMHDAAETLRTLLGARSLAGRRNPS